jgi:ribonuclease P protein component
LRTSEFRRVYENGRRRNLDFLAAFALHTRYPESRIGLTVPRSVGGAVQRNRVKRRLREAVRKNLELLGPGWDVVFNARPASKDATYAAIEAAVKNCFGSLQREAGRQGAAAAVPKPLGEQSGIRR